MKKARKTKNVDIKPRKRTKIRQKRDKKKTKRKKIKNGQDE
jgi:hypothetical protein